MSERCRIIAELSTNHGGDVSLAEDMIRAAADAGADYAKVQTYSLERLSPKDPQREWLMQSWLSPAAHERLLRVCETVGIQFLSTPFDYEALQMLRGLGLRTFKIASSESGQGWWEHTLVEWIVSWPWGRTRPLLPKRYVDHDGDEAGTAPAVQPACNLTAIPLYPTPLECVERAPLLDGWSDHGEGLSACYRALALGAQVLEVHMALAGRGRLCAWDKSPTELRVLRKFAEDCCTMRTGVAERFRTRWSA